MMGCRNPKAVIRDSEWKSPTIGWRAVNILNKPTIAAYSFEPPTT